MSKNYGIGWTPNTFQVLLKDLPERYQRVVILKRRGHTTSEIAARLRLGERTVRRVLDQLGTPDEPTSP